MGEVFRCREYLCDMVFGSAAQVKGEHAVQRSRLRRPPVVAGAAADDQCQLSQTSANLDHRLGL